MLPIAQNILEKTDQYAIWGRRGIASLGLTGILSLLSLANSPEARAAIQSFNVLVVQDGAGGFVGPDPNFPANPGVNTNSGNDANDQNGIVRTFDSIVYGWHLL